jgi:4-amino-4-deoxy-L-arabinose transferase-like glycosyltransferase
MYRSQRWLRAGSNEPRDVWLDVLWLLGLGLLLIGTGVGLRDPWPADEPRFALVARDMVATGDWLVPRVGGDLYADKPPLFFWLIALALTITHSLRTSFLLPSLLGGLGCLLLVYDLGRRLWNRETGLLAALALLFTVQFTWQARQAQIDATLCFWTTLSLYGLLRHLLLGPQWRWYAIGCAAAGLGVITKGVGFLPLLVVIPFLVLRWRGWHTQAFGSAPRWWWGPVAFVLAVSIWLVPMLLVSSGDPALAAYRDEILFRQTIDRFASAWHHQEPFWYFVVEVIPVLWLPLTALVPWLIPRWRAALRGRDLRIALLLGWILLVVLFFSASAGKRGVYILPALPAMALACGPFLSDLLSRRGVRRVGFVLAVSVVFICVAALAYALVRPDMRARVLETYDIDVLMPLGITAAVGMLLCIALRVRQGMLLYCGVFISVLLVVSFVVNPQINDVRSGARFTRLVEARTKEIKKLGIIAFKEQYLLQLGRPVVHFGHARWREADQEAADAAAWLQSNPQAALIVNERGLAACFTASPHEFLTEANRTRWYLVQPPVASSCVVRGRPQNALQYAPPKR